MLHALRGRASPALPNVALPQCRDPSDSQPRDECQRHRPGALWHALHHLCLCQVHSCRGKLESNNPVEVLERVCVSWNQLHIFGDYVRIVHDTRLDPHTDGAQFGQAEHHTIAVDCSIDDRILECCRRRTSFGQIELSRLIRRGRGCE